MIKPFAVRSIKSTTLQLHHCTHKGYKQWCRLALDSCVSSIYNVLTDDWHLVSMYTSNSAVAWETAVRSCTYTT